jgi:hypothetical protein
VLVQIEGTINFKLKAQYYNVQYAKWEPVIEPWTCEVEVRLFLCVCACVRACVRVCVRACVCVCVFLR